MTNKTIGLAITCFQEHCRPGKLWRAACIAMADPRIGELILRDDSGAGTAGERAFHENVHEIRRKAPPRLKVTANVNAQNLGVFGNKLMAIRDCESDWLQSLDSDNQVDQTYLDALFAQEWLPHLMFSPSFAEPEFDYRERAGFKITLSNVEKFLEWKMSSCMLNTGNQFMHVPTMKALMRGESAENFQVAQPDYFRVQDQRRSLHWRKVYDAGDSFYFNKRWLEAGNEILIVPGLQYRHEVHAASSWKAAPQQKDILPVMYALQLIDRARGETSDYLLDAVGIAYHVIPPLPVPPRTRVAVITKLIGSSTAWRLWVSIDTGKVLRVQGR